MFPKSICLNSTVSFTSDRKQIPNYGFSKQSSWATGTDAEKVEKRPASWHHQIFYKLNLTFYSNFYVPMGLHFLTKIVLTTCRKMGNFNIFWKITTNTWYNSNKELPVVSSSASHPFKAKLSLFIVLFVKCLISARETVIGSGMSFCTSEEYKCLPLCMHVSST